MYTDKIKKHSQTKRLCRNPTFYMKISPWWILDLSVKTRKVVERCRGSTGPRAGQGVLRKHSLLGTELTDWTLSTVRDGDIAYQKRACQKGVSPQVFVLVLTKIKWDKIIKKKPLVLCKRGKSENQAPKKWLMCRMRLLKSQDFKTLANKGETS